MIAYLDCFAGAAGDMILGALIDAGAPLDLVLKQIGRLDLGEIVVETEECHRRGIRATRVHISGGVPSPVRDYAAASSLLDRADLDEAIEGRARAIFARLAAAEARVHGLREQDAHFHEVDGIDTVVDVVGSAAAFESLAIQQLVCSPIATGTGTVETIHGTLPLPAPATLEILKGAVVYGRPIASELLTPTGAAIIAEYAQSYGPPPAMRVVSSGYGAGKWELEIPNVLRIVVGEPVRGSGGESIEELLIEATIDDLNPEIYPYVTERLLAAGISDVWLTPVTSKGGRPGAVISVMAPPPLEATVRGILIAETSTLGTRATRTGKWMAERKWTETDVEGHLVRVKIATDGDVVLNVAPEYADCAEVARDTGLPIKEVYRRALAGIPEALG